MKQVRNRLLMVAMAATLVLAGCDSGTPTPTPTPIPSAAAVSTATVGGIAVATGTPVEMAASIEKARTLLTQLSTGDFAGAAANFTPAMVAQLPPDKVDTLWKGLEEQYGKFKEQGPVQTGKQDVYDIVVIECLFEKAVIDMRVVIDNSGRIAGLFYAPATSTTPGSTPESGYTPPNYVQESSFTERELSFGAPEWVLTGTLTMPNSQGPHAAIVLVHGSGPLDRDETIGLNKPFRDLAWGLASQDVAVFRYDKRTLVYGAKMMATFGENITVKEEVVEDAVAALMLVKGIEGIEPSRVFLAGHSLGAMLAPMIAESTDAESGFIAMSAPSRPFEDVVLEQITYLANLDGTVSAEEQSQLDQLQVQVATVKKLETGSKTPSDQLPLGLPVAYWLSIKNYQPAAEAAKLLEPMLVLHGERDYQVTTADFTDWQTALKDKEDATLKSYPSLNHLFMAGTGTPTPNEYNQEGHVAESVIRDIADWVGRH